MIREFINGSFMAMADSVPGVSGGTIALIMGFYDEFIESIHNLTFGKGKKRYEAALYLFKLSIGWIFGMIAAVIVLSSAFESHIYIVDSLLIGLVLASIPLIINQEKEVLIRKYKSLFFSVVGASLVVCITVVNKNVGVTSIDLSHLTIPMILYVFVAGMIAISAMFLPGISGSTLLLIFGLYLPIITGIKEVLYLNFTMLPAIIILGLGVITGALTVVKGIKVCLEKFRTQTMYTIIGLMIGSLYAISMGPTTLEIPKASLSISNFSISACLIGIGIVIGTQTLGKIQNKKMSREEI